MNQENRNTIPTVYIFHYDFDAEQQTCKWGLTTNEEELIEYSDYSVANIADLHDWVAATGQIFNGIVSTQEGKVKWCESGSWDEELIDAGLEEEYECGYEIILEVNAA